MSEEKEYIVSVKRVEKIAEEFGYAVSEDNGQPVITISSPKAVSVEEENHCFDTFAAKDGLVYVSAPAIPLPMKATLQDNILTIKVFPLTKEYGIIYKRMQVNFERNIRFFLHEIKHIAFHFTSKEQQIPHPLSKLNN